MRSEEFVSPSAPHGISVNFESDIEDYDYAQIGKGVIHAFIIPLILYFVHPMLSSGYIVAASFLYATIFSHKSDGFFGVLAFVVLMSLFMIVA